MRRWPVGASAANSSRNLPCFVEQFLRPVALHPIFELLQMLGILEIGDRNLMCAPGALDRLAVDELRSGPALGRAEDDHRPARPLELCVSPRTAPHAGSRESRSRIDVERAGQTLMHQRRIVALDEMRLVAVAAHQVGQFLAADARQHRRVGDLEAVEMKDRKNRAVARGIEKFVGVPARGQRAGFRLAVADDAGDDQIRIVEGRAIGMRPGNIPARRLRGSSPAFPARRGSECRKARRIGGTAGAARFGCARSPDSAPCRSLRDRCAPPGPGPPWPGPMT